MRALVEGPSDAESLAAETLEHQLLNLHPGAHVCPIYSTENEQMRVLAAFFGGARIHHEIGVLLTNEAGADHVFACLAARGIQLEEARERGEMLVISNRERLLRDGQFSPDALLELHRAMSARAQRDGFAGARMAGDMNWILGSSTDRWSFLELESRLNDREQTGNTAIICQYARRDTSPAILRDLLRTHPLLVVDEHLHENVYFEPIDALLEDEDAERLRIEWMLSRLRSHTQRQSALVDLGRYAMAGASQRDLLRSAAALVASELNLDSVQLYELLPSGLEMRLVASLGPETEPSGRLERIDPRSPLADRALRKGQPLITDDWWTETRFDQPHDLRRAGIRSSVSVLISIGFGEHVYGVLNAHSITPRLFAEDEIMFLQAVAMMLAHALAAARGEESFRALVENASEVMVRFDHELRIVYVNPAIEQITGIPAESLVGRHSSALAVPEALLPRWELVLRHALRSGREQTTEIALRTSAGERHFEARIVPEQSADGAVRSMLAILRDVTEHRQVEAERSGLYRELLGQQAQLKGVMDRLVDDRAHTLRQLDYAVHAEQLSARERQILALLASGWTNREIGAQLGLSAGTIKNHVARILTKLDVSDRTQAAVRAVELGLVDQP